ncbi:MAG TPA: HAD-IA family hydrolase [Chloroflexota bacterium]|nr:HAD-IA family hydrolase [Chloroflexota bacterium]
MTRPPVGQTESVEIDVDSLSTVLFDLDGTLIDTTDLIFQSYRHAYRQEFGEWLELEDLYLGYGRPLQDAFGAILDHQGIRLAGLARGELIERLILLYREFNLARHDDLAHAFPGVREVVGELRQRGYRLGLVTSKSRVIAERGLHLIGLSEQFAVTVFMEDSRRHKPDPEPLRVALNRFGQNERPASALYVGDSTHDLIAGRAAGLQTGAALWGPFPPESLIALQPTYVLESAAALLTTCPSLASSSSGS